MLWVFNFINETGGFNRNYTITSNISLIIYKIVNTINIAIIIESNFLLIRVFFHFNIVSEYGSSIALSKH